MFAFLFAALLTADQPYEMADLQALANQGSYADLLAHADDIRPSKRDAAWQKLIESAALGVLEARAKDSDAAALWMAAEELAAKYPSLGKSKAYLSKLGPLALAGAGACFRQDDADGHCSKPLLADVQRDPSLSMSAGKVVLRNAFAYFAVPFFAPAVAAGIQGACADADLQRAVLAGLGLPGDDPKEPVAATIATGKCWPEFKAQLSKDLAGSGYTKDNACVALRQRKLLDAYQQVQCEGK